jgi:hypothetical protein
MNPRTVVVAILLPIVAATAAPTIAQEGGGDLRAAIQNPVGAVYSLPFKSTWDFGADNGDAYFLNIQPVIPFTVGKVNYINRVIAPVVSAPGGTVGRPDLPAGAQGEREFGLGDINYSLFFSPSEPGKLIWGVGPSVTFPTASADQLGTGKWSGGPTVVFLAQPKPWTVGVLFRQLWSFEGDDDRPDVNQFLMEPFVNYNLDKGWYLISDMVMTANWDAPSGDVWTVPVGGGAGKLFKAKVPVNFRVEAYYNVARPDAGPDWTAGFTLQFIFPKK